jgi:hypothetical protein
MSVREKTKADVEQVEVARPSSKFHEHEVQDGQAPSLTEDQEKRLWRKIDRRLMPMLSLMYLMSFLDRG